MPPRREHGAVRARALPLDDIDLLVIENVGNLVCPAEFKVGEDARIMVSSITEGEEKPPKYPLMFRACELVLINKIDLLPHLDFDLDKFLYHLDAVHPGVEHIWSARGPARGSRVARLARPRRRAGGGHRLTNRSGATSSSGARPSARGPTPSSSRPRRSGSLGCATASPERFHGREADRGRAFPGRALGRRHVAVEFVHPVIVGKRALPAIRLAGEGGRLVDQLALTVRARRHRDRVRRPRGAAPRSRSHASAAA